MQKTGYEWIYRNDNSNNINNLYTFSTGNELEIYELKYFIDQDGEIYNIGDPITKDMVLTPVYEDLLKAEDNLMNINIITEDNSDEEFEIDVYREADKAVYYSANEKSNYTFREEDWSIDENGIITSFLVDFNEVQNLYNKFVCTLHIDESENTEEKDIELETNAIGIGIPEEINGIAVKGISSNAFKNFKSTSELSDNDYSEIEIFLYLPKTLESFGNNDYTTKMFDEYTEMLQEEIDKLKEEGCYGICEECGSKVEKGVESCPDCSSTSIIKIEGSTLKLKMDNVDENAVIPPTIYMPTTYVTVDSENENYTSIHGSLYNKEVTKIYFLSYYSQGQSIIYGTWDLSYEPIGRNIWGVLAGVEGLEIPVTVKEAGLGYCVSYYNDMAIHYYGDGFKLSQYTYPEVNYILEFEDGSSVVLLDSEDIYYHKEAGGTDYVLSGALPGGAQYSAYIVDKKDNELVSNIATMYSEYGEVNWEDNESYSILYIGNSFAQTYFAEGSYRDAINTYGTISTKKPFQMYIPQMYIYERDLYEDNPLKEQGVENGDPFVRVIRFRNLPDRYIEPTTEECTFTADDTQEGVTINLKLKKGNIKVKTTDKDENNISATYNIVGEDGSVVETINCTSDGSVTSNKLAYGKYKIVPTTIQEGYDMPEEQEFEITEDGQILNIEFKLELAPEEQDPEPTTPEEKDPEPTTPEEKDPEPTTPEEQDSEPKVNEEPTKQEDENKAIEKLPYTGTTIGILIVVIISGGLAYLVYVGSKIYKKL